MERLKEHDIKAKLKYTGDYLPLQSGIRPVALIKDDYLTSVHIDFDNVDILYEQEVIDVSVTFITPEVYPGTLWIGKTIKLQVGAQLWGFLTVTEILNPLLKA